MDWIIGGTGSVGHELTRALLKQKRNILILSRDELKQSKMTVAFPDVKFKLCDVRDASELARVLKKYGAPEKVFHCAALKRIEKMEADPLEAFKTNLVGVNNVLEMIDPAEFHFLSTDKACLPINSYGLSKAMAEKLVWNSKRFGKKRFVYRWGNVVGSRGSFLHTVVDCLVKKKQVPITNLGMTRFWITLPQVVHFMLTGSKMDDCPNIPPMKAASVVDFVGAIAQAMGKDPEHTTYRYVGIRDGEKLHEDLRSEYELGGPTMNSKTAPQYTRDELVELVQESVLDVLSA